ncbi:unnamed protein product [Soboliphyme baturini]|uniref:Uncharacterized protein n=1 Tax=Soboliphyme baturini TaxID=241478 RepID=A0A183IY10_9BILA|nr:unnamed protein product [Soboliphyme baturini]
MDTPFRCLDEFDIFMDIVNRRMSSQMLVDFALNSSKCRQYFFLTPLEIRY